MFPRAQIDLWADRGKRLVRAFDDHELGVCVVLLHARTMRQVSDFRNLGARC